MANIKARNPVMLGLCTEADLKKAVSAAEATAEKSNVPFDVEDADEE